jgi:hypothetical protein
VLMLGKFVSLLFRGQSMRENGKMSKEGSDGHESFIFCVFIAWML